MRIFQATHNSIWSYRKPRAHRDIFALGEFIKIYTVLGSSDDPRYTDHFNRDVRFATGEQDHTAGVQGRPTSHRVDNHSRSIFAWDDVKVFIPLDIDCQQKTHASSAFYRLSFFRI